MLHVISALTLLGVATATSVLAKEGSKDVFRNHYISMYLEYEYDAGYKTFYEGGPDEDSNYWTAYTYGLEGYSYVFG